MEETGRAPRALLPSHPNNPLRICYPPHFMEECIDWCREREVHLISDGIYAGSLYINKYYLSLFFTINPQGVKEYMRNNVKDRSMS